METIAFVITIFLVGLVLSLIVVQMPKEAFKQWDTDAKDYLNIKHDASKEHAQSSVWGLAELKSEFHSKPQRHVLLGGLFLIACLPVWLTVTDLLTTILMCGVIGCIAISALIDWDHMYIPDEAIVLGLGLTFIALIMQGESLEGHVIGTMIGYWFIAVLRWIFYHFRGIEGVGLGDAKLLALIGALIGASDIFSSIIVACIIAIAMNLLGKMAKSKHIPFGPGIAISGLFFYYLKLLTS